jgi:hypothetical protein
VSLEGAGQRWRLSHQNVVGVNFWEERGGAQQIRQDAWVHYQDGADEAALVVRLGWCDLHKVRLVQQELLAVYRPLPAGEAWLELQTTFTPATDRLPLGRTNFWNWWNWWWNWCQFIFTPLAGGDKLN